MFDINSCEVFLEKRHAEAAPSMCAARVVRFVSRVRLIETVKEFRNLRCPGTDEVGQPAGDALFPVAGKLGARRWDPNRHSLEAVRLEGPRIAKRFIDAERPPLASSRGIGKRPRPRGIVEESLGDEIDNGKRLCRTCVLNF
jgi:hypothetical protein